MALPITDLPSSTVGFPSNTGGSWRSTVNRTKQAKPYDTPAKYNRYFRINPHYNAEGVVPYSIGQDVFYVHSHPVRNAYVYSPDGAYGHEPYFATELGLARNRSLDWLRDELGASAGLGIALAQSNQAFQMIAKRASSLLKFTTKLRKLDLGGAWRALEVTPKRLQSLTSKEVKLKSGAKHFANNFLEVHFGWAPLVGDIFDAIDTLQSPIPLGKVRGFGSMPFDHEHTWSEVNPISPDRGNVQIISRHVGKVKVRCGCEVWVDNPNLYLANRLGLTNPALIVYDAIPFSFVLNWFITVEQFLSQFNMFAGLQVRNTWQSVRLTDSCNTSLEYSAPYYGESGKAQAHTLSDSFVRTTALPGYAIVAKPKVLTSPTRALTAVSLLIQKGLKT